MRISRRFGTSVSLFILAAALLSPGTEAVAATGTAGATGSSTGLNDTPTNISTTAGLDGTAALAGQAGIAAGDSFDLKVNGVTVTVTILASDKLTDIAARISAISGAEATATSTGTNDTLTITTGDVNTELVMINNNNTPLTAMGFTGPFPASLDPVATAPGDGGDGGAGATHDGDLSALTISGATTGGAGGAGGTTAYNLAATDGGDGGDGGAGLSYDGAAPLPLTVTGAITGGDGGDGGAGSGGGAAGADGAGGVGVANLDPAAAGFEIINSGTISGGLSGDGATRANAIELTNTGNTLTLRTGSSLIGNVVLGTGANTLKLDGNGSEDADFREARTVVAMDGTSWTLTGDLQVSAGAMNFDTRGTLTVGGTVTANAITKTGGGRLEITGDNSAFSGTTTLNAGTLVVGVGGSGSLGGTVQVNAGTFKGTSTLGGSLTLSGGTHAPGNSIGTQTVAGDYILGGTLEIEVQPGASDRVVVGGDVTINNATLKVLELTSSGWSQSERFTIIDNQGANAVSGDFGSVQNQLAFLTASYLLTGGDGNDVVMTLARNDYDFSSVANTVNQRATADGLEVLGVGNALYDGFAGLSSATARANLDMLSGEIHATAQSVLLSNALSAQSALSRRMGDTGAASGKIFSYQALPGDAKGPRAWMAPYGNWGHLAGDGNAASATYDGGGLLFGLDAEGSGWRVGMMGGYGRSWFRAPGRAGSGDIATYSLGVHAGRQYGEFDLSAGLVYDHHDISTRRDAYLGGLTQNLTASYGAHSFAGFAEAALPIAVGEFMTLTPFAGVTRRIAVTGAYDEQGGSLGLSSSNRTSNSMFTRLGLRAERIVLRENTPIRVHGGVFWRHRLNGYDAATHSFSGGSDFTVRGSPVPRDSAELSAGLTFDFAANASLDATYRGSFSAAGSRHEGRVTFGLKF